MRFACLLIERLPTRLEILRKPELSGQPLVVLRPWDEHVLDATPSAGGAGVGPGDARHRVEKLCPQATVLMADESLYQATHDAAEAALANFAGPVEVQALGEFFIEISSLTPVFGGGEVLEAQLVLQAQRAIQLMPTLGIAGNKFTAAKAARQATTETSGVLVVPDRKERAFLDSLPLSALPDPPAELLRRLHLFGITTLGGFARLPRAAVTRQFGPDVAIFHDLTCGLDPRPLVPKSPPPMVMRKLALPHPLSDRRLLLNHLEQLVGQLVGALRKGGFHTTALTLAVTDSVEQEHTSGAAVKPPTADTQQLQRLARRLLSKLPLQSAAAELCLTAYPLREWHLGARQLPLFKSADRQLGGHLQQVLHGLRRRFGERVVRLASTLGPPLPLPIKVWCQLDGTPVALRLHWSGWSRKVERVYEYWRECWRWWDRLVVREYYQVEANDGLVFTLFRDGQGRWFLERRRI